MPVPPPTSAIGVCPKRCSQARPITGTRLPTWSESAVGIESDVGGDGALGQPFGEPRGRVLDEAAGRQGGQQIGHRRVSYPLETGLATG